MASENPAAVDGDPGPDELLGKQLGDFKIHKLLGQGGMGEVYLAEQVSLKRRVALKVLRRDLVDDHKYLQRFQAEAKAVAPISHPNIVSVIAIGNEGNCHYIALEYVQGINLREYMSKKGTLDAATCRFIMRKVAEALQRAGEEGIVHRDIKPENVLVTRKNEVKVADFGLARQLTAEKVDLTQSGVTMGTPLYMSPEQVEGEPLDCRSDIYSFGVMCYHMMAGQPPFRGETALAVAIQHVKSKAQPLREIRTDLPEDLIAIVDKMMAKKREKRYQTAKEIIADLTRVRSKTGAARIDETQDLDEDLPEAVAVALAEPVTKDKRLVVLSQTVSAVGKQLIAPKNRTLVAGTCMVLALAAGVAMGWSTRQHNVFAPGDIARAAPQAPDLNGIAKRQPLTQLLWAREFLPPEQREVGLWAVIIYFPEDETHPVEAARELVQTYLSLRQYDQAMLVASALIGLDDNSDGTYTVWDKESRQAVTISTKPTNGDLFVSPASRGKVEYQQRAPIQRVFGYLFKGIIQSRRNDAMASNQSFFKMVEIGKKVPIPLEYHKWLAREYFIALNRNFKVLGRERNKKMVDDFWKTFPPPPSDDPDS